jgi:hypothetical protein
MRLRRHRQDLVIWSSSAGSDDRYAGLRLMRLSRARRIRRWIRTGALLTVVGLMPLARAVRARWRLLLPGSVLTVIGLIDRSGAVGVALLPGLLLLFSAPFVPASPQADRTRRSELERELAAYSTTAQRHDLEAVLDGYADGVTYELRDILARQAVAALDNQFPGGGRR